MSGEPMPYGRVAPPAPRRRAVWILSSVIIALVIAIIVAMTVIFTGGAQTARYEAADFMTPHPFTEPVLNDDVDQSKQVIPPESGTVQVSWLPSTACDPAKLKRQLAERPAAAGAFAEILNIKTTEIDSFIDGLQSAVLTVPMQVTNHDYESGEPRELQSVLAAGTAVLVDDAGAPVVRCACGNPLKPAKERATEVTGAPEGFDLAQVIDEPVAVSEASAGESCGAIDFGGGVFASVIVEQPGMTCQQAVETGYRLTGYGWDASDLPITIECGITSDSERACGGPEAGDAVVRFERASDMDSGITAGESQSAPAITEMNLANYRIEPGNRRAAGYSWVTEDRRVLCTVYSDAPPACFLSDLRPPFSAADQCSYYDQHGVRPDESSVLHLASSSDGVCHSLLQGNPGDKAPDGRWAALDAPSRPVRELPDNSAIVVPSEDGPVRCVSQVPQFSCHFVNGGAGYTISPTEAVFVQ